MKKSLAEELFDAGEATVDENYRLTKWEDWEYWRAVARAARRLCAGPGAEELMERVRGRFGRDHQEEAEDACTAIRACFAAHKRRCT